MEQNKTKFVVGLGNPGRQYCRTRHNVGFMVLDKLRNRWQADAGRNGFGGLMNEVNLRSRNGRRKVVLLEPHTYMNRSGSAVAEMVAFYKADLCDVLVVLDDLALPPGKLRFRRSGSAGGHNGLEDIIQALGSDSVSRLRIGIGQQPAQMDVADFVLQSFGKDEAEIMENAVSLAVEAVEDWVLNGIDAVMKK